jgi:positive regulator of sigma E activity
LMFGSALLATFFADKLELNLSQAWISLFAVLGLLAGFAYARLFARSHQADERYHPVILRRITFAEQYSVNHLHKV